MNPAIDYDTQLVMYTQKTFRCILDSMARPGKINTIELFPLHYTAEEIREAPFILGIACTLLDVEVSFHIVNPNFAKLVTDLEFHTNSRMMIIAEADYIVMTPTDDPNLLYQAKRGNLDFPDGSATVLLLVDNLQTNSPLQPDAGVLLELKGPGILNQKELLVDGVSADFFRIFKEINSEFPLGLDLILIQQQQVACIPRSTTIQIKRDA